MKPLKTYFSYLWISLFILGFVQNGYSSHIVGGDIRYECLGNNNYKFTMKVYRDCYNGQAPLDANAAIGIYTGSNPNSTYQTLSVRLQGPTNIPPVLNNPCLILPPNICVEQGLYEFTVNLPFNATGYNITYQRCCRNNTINNINSPGGTGSTYSIFLSAAAQQICNNSPVFRNFPPIVICAGEILSFDHSATDTEGHRIEYSFCNPLEGGSPGSPMPNPPPAPPYIPVTYISPYSVNNPVLSSPALSINPTTGLISGTPTTQGQYVVGICATEYDANNAVLSVIQRDFQFNVTTCNRVINAQIQSNGINAQGQYIVNSCDNNVITFVNQSQDRNFITGYLWRFDLQNGTFATSTTTNPTITFPGVGIYTGILVVNPGTVGCTDTAQIRVTVFPPRNAEYTNQIDSCNPDAAIRFIDQSVANATGNPIKKWEWNFGDGTTSLLQNPSHSFPNAGTYTVSLKITDNNDCTDDIVKQVAWFPASKIRVLFSDTAACVPHRVDFTNQSFPFTPDYRTEWDFGDGSPPFIGTNASHTYTSPGLYTVKVRIISPWGCVSERIYPDYIRVYGLPDANFSFAFDSCTYMPVTFTDGSNPYDNSQPLTNWFWNFADGNTTNGASPFHQYTIAGTFGVKLRITDIFGCSDSTFSTVEYYPAPIIDIKVNVQNGCVPQNIFYDNRSYPINGYTTAWDFGDGTTSLQASPNHIFTQEGTYIIKLKITSPKNCISEYADTITVYARPMAEFTFRQDSCKVDSVFFTNQSSPNRYNDPITGYQWSFGDGRSSTLTNPGHLYAAAGTYTVKLITTDIHGCTDTAAHIVNWYPAPVINFDLINGDACAPFTVDAATIITPLLPNNYTTFWDFGDGTTSTQNYPVHIYNNDGTYKIRLSVISPNGCRGADSTVVSVHGRPVANFTFGSDTCVLGPIPFQSTSFSANDTIVRYTWDFGDNITSIAKNPIYQYMSPGTYTVTLRVVDSYGCRDSIQKSLSWYPAPNLKINMDKHEGCSPQTVQFRYNAGTFNLASYSKLWDFGDGTTSQDSTPVHLYPNPGLYYVRFSVTSLQSGCSSSVLDSIRIFASPTANFTASYQACELSAVSFTDGSTVGDVPITSWKWSFGDGGTSAQPSPQHVYNDTAVYNVRLIVRDQKGCSDTITKDVPWLPKPVFPVRLYDKRGCVSYTTDFEARGYPIDGYKTYWFFGDGQGSADPKPSHTFDQIGTYPLRLVITSPMGCTDTFYAQTIVSPKPTAQFSYSPHELSNLNPTVQFTDLSSNSGAWEWDFGTGSRSSIRNPKYVYPDTGKFQVNLIITDQNGCRDTASKIVDIIPKFTYYLPNAFSPNNDGINDGFRGTGIMDKINAFEMTIWNRWGEMVFQTNNPTDEWNGRKNNTGVLSPAGVYVVVVKLKGGRGEVQELKGYATLVH